MVRLHLLGRPAVVGPDGTEVAALRAQPKLLALLAYLGATPGMHSRETILGLLWPDSDSERARASLRQALYTIRQTLGKDCLRADGKGLIGVDASAVTCDVVEFGRLLDDGHDEEALALYGGPFMDGFHVTGAPELEHWMDGQRRALQLGAVAAAWRLVEAADAAGESAASMRWAERALELAPYDEAGFRRYMELLAAQGDRALALLVYERLAAKLHSDLEVMPSTETMALAKRLRQPTLPTAPLSGRKMSTRGAEPGSVSTGRAGSSRRHSHQGARSEAGGPLPKRIGVHGGPQPPAGSGRLEAPKDPISRVLAVPLAALAVIGTIWWVTTSPPPRAVLRSVVVLPFQNVTGDTAEEPFLGFLRDELSGRLAQIDGVEKVISRYSAAQFAGAAPERIAEELDVDAVMTVMATMGNDSVTLSVELNAGREDRVVLSNVYERPVRNVQALLNEITEDVAEALQITLAAHERARLQDEEPVDPTVLRAWALGRAALPELTIEGMERAIGFFREAIAIDPAFAAGYAGLAMAYSELAGWWGPPGETEEYAALARAAAGEALRLDSTMAEAYVALGNAAKYQWDWTTAEEALRHGMMWSPETSVAHVMYANFLMHMGRYEEAISAARDAVRLDPLAPLGYNELAFALWRSGDVEGARSAYSDSHRVAPDFHQTHELQAIFHADIGEGETAVRHAQLLSDPDLLGRGYIAWVYGVSGDHDQARAILAELEVLERDAPVPAYAFALAHLGLEEWDLALNHLDEAFEQQSPSLLGLREGPMHDPLRSDPRFQDLLERMGFPW